MELKITDGGYTKGAYHSLESVSGSEELAQRVMMRLKARRGGFPVLPDYGSRLYTLTAMKPSEWEGAARKFVAEALAEEDVLLEALSVREDDGHILIDLRFRQGSGSFDITTGI